MAPKFYMLDVNLKWLFFFNIQVIITIVLLRGSHTQVEFILIKKLYFVTKKVIIRGISMLNEVLEVNFFFSHVLVPLLVLVLYCTSFEYVLTPILLIPKGVNYVFVSRSWKYFSLFAVVSSLIFIVIFLVKKEQKLVFKNSIEKISGGDLFLLLLPLTPVVQYILHNQDILSPVGALYVFFTCALFSALYIFVIPASLGFVGSTRMLITLGLAFVYTILSMASLSHSFAWFQSGSLEIQWVFFGSVFLVTWLFYGLSDKKFLRYLIAVIFVTNSMMQLLPQDDRTSGISDPVAENRLVSLLGDRIPAVTTNIYLLVYDAYVSNETMLAYGIDNSSQEEYIKEQGFKLYPHTYSVGEHSVATMSRVLNVSTNLWRNDRKAVSGDGIVQNTLKGFGYKTYGLFQIAHFFLGIESTYDVSIPELSSSSSQNSSPDVLWRAILTGEFRFDAGFDLQPRDLYIENKQRIFKGISGDPVFIYMHSNSPGHTQNSGACLAYEIDRFEMRLADANIEMRQDINTIIENDPEAIIIVAGDHGPFLTRNCYYLEEEDDSSEISRLDIQDRFGTFLAIRWPTEEFVIYDDIIVLQDLFPAVFAYLFEDERLLELKVEPSTLSSIVTVRNGIIYGGINDGEPLFMTDK
jgi:hypothetical protein